MLFENRTIQFIITNEYKLTATVKYHFKEENVITFGLIKTLFLRG